MTETIPNPLTDEGVKSDINHRVEDLLHLSLGVKNIDEAMRHLIKRAAEWGYSEGFRMGWRVYQNTKGKSR